MAGTKVSSAGMGVAGAMMRGVSRTGTRGLMKVDDDDTWLQMLGCVSSMGQVTDMGGGLSGHGECVEMGKSRCV